MDIEGLIPARPVASRVRSGRAADPRAASATSVNQMPDPLAWTTSVLGDHRLWRDDRAGETMRLDRFVNGPGSTLVKHPRALCESEEVLR